MSVASQPARAQDSAHEMKWVSCSVGWHPLQYETPLFLARQVDWDRLEDAFRDYVASIDHDPSLHMSARHCYGHSADRAEAEAFEANSKAHASAGMRYVLVQWDPTKAQQPLLEKVLDAGGKSASLAIDRDKGSLYGWAVDHANFAQSDARALAECKERGGACQVVLRVQGGCGAYVAQQSGGNAYGWGYADTRAGAEAYATGEAQMRGGADLVTRVWGCNSAGRKRDPVAGPAPAPAPAGPSPADLARTARERELTTAREAQSRAEAEQAAAVRKIYDDVLRRDSERARQTAQPAAPQPPSQVDQANYQEAVRRHAEEVAKARAAEQEYERKMAAWRAAKGK